MELIFVVLVLVAVKLLYVNSVLLGQTLQYAGLVKLLTGTEFLYNTGPFELSLELLQGAFNVFALFNLYYDHFVSLDFILLLLYCVIFLMQEPTFTRAEQRVFAYSMRGAKLRIYFITHKLLC